MGSTFKDNGGEGGEVPSEGGSPVVIKASPTVRRLVGVMIGITHASTGVLVAKRGKAKGRVLTRRVRQLSAQGRRSVMAMSVKTVDRSLFRDRLFKRRHNSFASTCRDQPKGFRTTSNDSLFVSRVKGLPLTVRTGLLAMLRGQGVAHVNDGGMVPISVQLLSTAGGGVRSVISSKAFHRSLLCELGAVRLRVPPLHRQERSVRLFVGCFVRHCTTGCRGGRVFLRRRTLRGLYSCR